MGEMYPPTMADYAYSAANEAHEKNKKLDLRVSELEKRFEKLEKYVNRLEGVIYSRG